MKQVKRICGYCRYMGFPDEVCTNRKSPMFADWVVAHGEGCGMFDPVIACPTCRYYVNGSCMLPEGHYCKGKDYGDWENAAD